MSEPVADKPAKLPYLSNPFVIIWAGFKLLAVNLGPLILAVVAGLGLLLTFLPGAIAIIIGAASHNDTVIVIGAILALAALVVSIIIGVRLSATTYLIYLANVEGKTGEFSDFYRQSKKIAWRLFGLNVLTGLIVGLGFLLLIVPGILFAYWFMLARYVMVKEDCSIGEALERSRELVRGHGWEMFGLLGAVQIISLLAYIPFVGYVVSTVLGVATASATTLRYVQLKNLDEDEQPTKSAWNYVATLLAPIVLTLVVTFAITNALNQEANKQSLPSPTPTPQASDLVPATQ